MDCFYYYFIKTKVCKGRSGKPFPLEAELKKKNKNLCANDLVPIRKAIKQIVPRMKTVEKKQRECIEMLFG